MNVSGQQLQGEVQYRQVHMQVRNLGRHSRT